MAFKFADARAYPYREGAIYLGEEHHGNEVGIFTERHGFTVGGSRSGKGAALLIPNARRWPGTLLCIDPKGENLEQTYEHREALGQRVYALMPFGGADVPERLRATFNPLRDIDLSSPTARARLQAIADGLVVVHDPRHMEWTDGARSILAGLMAYMIEQAPPEQRTFATMRALLMQPDEVKDAEGNPALDANGEPIGLYADAQRMAYSMAGSGLARAAGVSIMTAITAEKGMDKDFLGLAKRSTAWLDDQAIAATLGGDSSFSLAELREGTASVYLVLPPDFIETNAAFLRLIVSCALNAMAEGRQKHQAQCLFLLDEFYALGRIDKIRTSAGLMPSYGVHLWPFVQNYGDVVELYGPHGMAAMLNNSDAVIFLGVGNDLPALEYISKRVGPLTPREVVSRPPLPAAFQGPRPPAPRPFEPLPMPAPRPFIPLAQPDARAYRGGPPPSKDQWYEETHLARGFLWTPAESENQSRERLSTHQENQMREWQHGNSQGEAAHRASEETRMREWQRSNAAAEAEHRAAEEARMREWQRKNAMAEAAHRADEEARMREWQQDTADLRAMHEAEQTGVQRFYDFAMREAFTPRLPPDEIVRLTGKGHGEKLARSMIVFAPAGDVLNVKLVPYFRPARVLELPAPVQPAPVALPTFAELITPAPVPALPKGHRRLTTGPMGVLSVQKGRAWWSASGKSGWREVLTSADDLRGHIEANLFRPVMLPAFASFMLPVLAALTGGSDERDLSPEQWNLNAARWKSGRKIMWDWGTEREPIRYVIPPAGDETAYLVITKGDMRNASKQAAAAKATHDLLGLAHIARGSGTAEAAR